MEFAQNNEALQRHADERDGVLREIANWVHDSVPVSKVCPFNLTRQVVHEQISARYVGFTTLI